MWNKFLREFFLLRPWEQRALIMVSALLVASFGIRLWVHCRPLEESPGMEAFRKEALRLIKEMQQEAGEAVVEFGSGQEHDSPAGGSTLTGNLQKSGPKIELNSADSTELIPLPGIGPVYSSRIVRYRELLGGYLRKDQLLEVYGMDSSRYLPLLEYLELDTMLVRKIDLDGAEFRDLLHHPYLDFEAVKSLVNYREQAGRIGSLQELRQNAILPDSLLDRISGYLSYE